MPGFELPPELHREKKVLRPSDKTTATALKFGLESAAQIYFAACRSAAASLAALPKMKKQSSNQRKF